MTAVVAPDALAGLREAMAGIGSGLTCRGSRPSQEAAVGAVNASVHVHGRDFEVVHAAIRKVARANAGVVDPNLVRAALTDARGDLVVYPRTVGAQYSGLRARGILTPHGWTTSTDKRGRNAGKPARVYLVTDAEWLAASAAAVHSNAETGELFAAGDLDG